MTVESRDSTASQPPDFPGLTMGPDFLASRVDSMQAWAPRRSRDLPWPDSCICGGQVLQGATGLRQDTSGFYVKLTGSGGHGSVVCYSSSCWVWLTVIRNAWGWACVSNWPFCSTPNQQFVFVNGCEPQDSAVSSCCLSVSLPWSSHILLVSLTLLPIKGRYMTQPRTHGWWSLDEFVG